MQWQLTDFTRGISCPIGRNFKFDRMRAVLRAKFTQHDDFRQILLSTGDARLVEAARVANGVNRDSLVSLIALVDGADFAPSAESFAALQRVCVAMNATLEKWQELKEKDLAAFRKVVDPQKPGAIPDYPAIAVDANCGK
jgi:hypothetical protein